MRRRHRRHRNVSGIGMDADTCIYKETTIFDIVLSWIIILVFIWLCSSHR